MRWDQQLWARLALSFATVTLITVVLVAFLMSANTDIQFRQYLIRREMLTQSGLIDALRAYYQQRGDWSGVEALLETESSSPMGGMGRGRSGMGMGGHTTYLLADAQKQIVVDSNSGRIGQYLTRSEESGALVITSPEGSPVGYLIALTGRGMMPDEQSFLAELQQTLLLSALLAAGIGAGIGILLSRGLSKPLKDLTQAAQTFALKDWSKRVSIQGSGEIARVGNAFNAMADDLQRLEKLRQNLIADIAHELRTPLTVMEGNLRALLDGVYPLEMGEVATLFDQTHLLKRLVEDLRELALADAGQLHLSLTELDPLELIRVSALPFSTAADSRGIRLILDLPVELPFVRIDRDRFRQALTNLLSNALRHTAQGSITLQAITEPDQSQVQIRILDTGEGIPAEDLPHLFERFYRGEKSRARSAGGSGLGLAIARSLVEAMGGKIGAQNGPSGGAVFWFTVPISASP